MARRERQLAHARAALAAAQQLVADGYPWSASTRAAWGLGAVRHATPDDPEAYELRRSLEAIRDAV